MYLSILYFYSKINIKKFYKQLNWIIYKNKFLIPKPPEIINSKAFFLQKYLKNQQSSYSPSYVNVKQTLQNMPKEKIQKIDLQYKQHQKQYHFAKEQYQKKYINPTKIPYLRGISIFFRETNQKISSKKAIEQWNLLSPQIKQSYEAKVQKIKDQNIPYIEQFYRNHQIPTKKIYNSYDVFARQYKPSWPGSTITSQYIEFYQKLDKKTKQYYKQIAKEQTMRSQTIFLQFLKSYNLSEKDLQYIRKICNEYTLAYKGKKRVKKINLQDQQQ